MNGIITTLLLLAGAGHLIAGLLLLTRGGRGCWIAFTSSWLLVLGIWVLTWFQLGEPPFGNMYHVLLLIALCFLPAQRFLEWREGQAWTAPAFAFMAALVLVGAACMEHDNTWSRMPALRSGWFVPHVASYTLAYSLAGTAFLIVMLGLAHAYLVNSTGEGSIWTRTCWPLWRAGPPRGGWRPSLLPRCREAATAITRLAFPFMTFGLCSGALWAEEAWGAYWQWDPKETWSLITWLLYAMALHCQARAPLRIHVPLLQVLAFIALLITFIGVNLVAELGSLLHSYA